MIDTDISEFTAREEADMYHMSLKLIRHKSISIKKCELLMLLV
jgi:hypothetical protein